MATIINNPPPQTPRDNGRSFLLGVLLLLVVVWLFFYYGLPALRGSMAGPQITVPGKIDVNVHAPQK